MMTGLPPPPLMIFSSKLKVRQCHSNEGSDYKQDDEDDKENAVDSVNSVAPHASKYVVEFNVDCTERKKTSHCHLWNSSPIPRQWWNLSRIFGSATRSLELSLAVFTSYGTQDKQRRGYQCPY